MFTAFSWGYWGWGTRTQELRTVVDAIERRRGWRPPLFVDIRWRRSVRAIGFSQSAFEDRVGKNRYRWIKDLGNRNIESRNRGVNIANPNAAEDLLGLIIEAAKQRRRVIFFCACDPIRYPNNCHRSHVAKLLLKEASKTHRALAISEWPGGKPTVEKLAVDPKIIRAILRGGNRAVLPEMRWQDELEYLSLPWCSRVELRSVDDNDDKSGHRDRASATCG